MRLNDLTGQKFGDWTVESRAETDKNGHIMWNCVDSNGNKAAISGYRLQHKPETLKNIVNASNKMIDLTGQTFGEWTVLNKVDVPGGKQGAMWLCRCSCGKEAVVNGKRLRGGLSKSCGHNRGMDQFIDLTGQKFGALTAVEYLGKHKWKCICLCGNETIVGSYSLRSGEIKSCGCLKEQHRKETLMQRYGDTNTERIENPREEWQMQAMENKDNLRYFILNYIEHMGHKPTRKDLAETLDAHISTINNTLKAFGLGDIVQDVVGTSYNEKDIKEFVKDICNQYGYKLESKNRDILDGEEIDIYIPDIKLGIEYNGSYYHSELFKDKKYHFNKSKKAAEKGVRLIHIFDYEYISNEESIKSYLYDIISKRKNIINARECKVDTVSAADARKFLNINHLQGYAASEIYLGLIYKNEIVAIMTFGTPRFSKECDKELVRLAVKYGTIINGGIDKLFKYYVDTYKPKSIVSYCDISKFIGGVYKRLGFENCGISEPNYKWINTNTLDIMSRYQTQKGKLIEMGIGSPEQSESDIMHEQGYIKVYDCGSIKYVWNNKK